MKNAPAIERITINLDIDDFSIKGLKMKIPKIVRKDAINPSNERNSWSKFNTSISNQLPPWPTPGMALKTKIIIAVPNSIFFAFASNSLDNLKSNNNIIPNDPTKTISCENWILDVPTANVKKTKIIEPTMINTFGLVSSGLINIIPLAL